MSRRRRIPKGDKRHHDRVTTGLREMFDAGQGVWNIRVAFRDEAPELLLGAILGDQDTILFARQVEAAARLLDKQAPLCLLCDAFPRLGQIAAIIICSTEQGHGNPPVMSNVLCEQCQERIGTKAAILQAVKAKYLDSFEGWREIMVSSQTGHA